MADLNFFDANFESRFSEKFAKNGGKLFCVDNSKSFAVKALSSLLKKEKPEGLLVLVEDGASARECADLLSFVGNFAVADSEEALSSLLSETGSDPSSALSFRRKHPFLVVAFTEGERAVFHKQLGENRTRSGHYYFDNREGYSPYFFSDFLSDAQYPFVVVDNVFAFLNFTEKGKGATPLTHDRVRFYGAYYYTDAEHSYRRLKNITGGAEKCVLLSDRIAGWNAVNLYAALELLHDRFCFPAARKFIRSIATDYEEECERVYNDISNCKNDESILSGVLQRTRGNPQRVPGDMRALDAFIDGEIAYMSEEEIYLRTVTSYITGVLSGRCRSSEDAIGRLEESTDEIVRCFYDMFFGDPLKGALESALSTPFLARMTANEYAALARVCGEYGAIHAYKRKKGACTLVRIFREDAGFEYFVRGNTEEDLEGDVSYSATGRIGGVKAKCIVLSRMLTGKEKRISLRSPLLVVTSGGTERIARELGEVLKDYSVTEDLDSLAAPAGEKKAVVTEYALLRRTARWLNTGSVAFFDYLPDPSAFGAILNKTLSFGETPTVVFADYADMSGIFFNAWKKDVLVPDAFTAPMGVSVLSLKEGSSARYATITERVEEVYRAMDAAVSKGRSDDARLFADRFRRILTEFTLEVSDRDVELASDFTYLGQLSDAFEGVFRNSVSVGSAGEAVSAEKTVFVRDTRTKEVRERTTEEAQPARLYFNACTRMLLRTCDPRKRDCNGCTERSDLLVNRFELFTESVREFFARTREYLTASQAEDLRMMRDITLGGAEEDTLFDLEPERLDSNEAEALRILDTLSENGKKGAFGVGFEEVEKIRRAVSDTYGRILGKYYKRTLRIFDAATDKMKLCCRAANEGFVAAQH